MGVSIYPVLDRDVPGFDVTETAGKALAEAVFHENSRFSALERFSSQNEEALADFIADQTGQEANTIEVPVEEWFSPAEGLQTVRFLLAHTSQTPSPTGWEHDDFLEGLAADLTTLESVLLMAQKHGAKFHLEMDF